MNDQPNVLQIDRTDPTVPVLTLNRPERLNALNMDLIAQLHTAFASMDDDPNVRAVILTGSGRAFSAGLDIKEPGSVTDGAPIDRGAVPATFQIQEHIASLHERIHRLRKPVIAAVNGVAVGGGFSLALAADLRIASTTASFGAVFITLGISNCDMGVSYFLPRLVGASRSAELLLTGRMVESDEAERIGLVTSVVDPDQLIESAKKLAALITRHSPLGVWMTKETMWNTIDAPSLRSALDIENRTQVLAVASLDGGLPRSPRSS